MCFLLVKSIYCLWNIVYCLFNVSVHFLFTLLAEIALVSEIVECVGDCGMCRRLCSVSEIVEWCLLLVKSICCLWNVAYCLFNVSVDFCLPSSLGWYLCRRLWNLSEIVECVGDCGMLSIKEKKRNA